MNFEVKKWAPGTRFKAAPCFTHTSVSEKTQ